MGLMGIASHACKTNATASHAQTITLCLPVSARGAKHADTTRRFCQASTCQSIHLPVLRPRPKSSMARPTSLTAQLSALRVVSAPSAGRGKPSLLYSPQEAAELDLASLRTLGSAGECIMHDGEHTPNTRDTQLASMAQLASHPAPRLTDDLACRVQAAGFLGCTVPAFPANPVQRGHARVRSQQPATGCRGAARCFDRSIPSAAAGALPAPGSIPSPRVPRPTIPVSTRQHIVALMQHHLFRASAALRRS